MSLYLYENKDRCEIEKKKMCSRERERPLWFFIGNYSINASARCVSYKYSCVSNNCVLYRKVTFLYFFFSSMTLRAPVNSAKMCRSYRDCGLLCRD